MSENTLCLNNSSLSIENLISQLGSGYCSPVPYDTAVLATVPDSASRCKPGFPAALEWLRKNQTNFGYWGSSKPFIPWNLAINTLSASIALKTWNFEEDHDRLAQAEVALHFISEFLQVSPPTTVVGVAFEYILPLLIQEAKLVLLNLDYSIWELHLEKFSGAKLPSKLTAESFQKPQKLHHSLEIFGRSVNPEFLEPLVGTHGCIGGSPAASAFALRLIRTSQRENKIISDYMESEVQRYNGGCGNVFPNIFELAWSLEAFLRADSQTLREHLEVSVKKLHQMCVPLCGFSTTFQLYDSDDSSVALGVLEEFNQKDLDDEKFLLPYFNGTYVTTFGKNEELPSISTNLHFVGRLGKWGDPAGHEAVQKSIEWLIENGIDGNGNWKQDKWHLSKFYTFYCGYFALVDLRKSLVDITVQNILKEQNEDGGWGKAAGGSTLEETAYVVLCLAHAYRTRMPALETALLLARDYMNTQCACVACSMNHAKFWIGKVLYTVPLVIASFVAAAKIAIKQCNLNDANANVIKSSDLIAIVK